MKKLLDFLNNYGILILVLLGLMIFINTCGTSGKIERNGRRIDKLEKGVIKLDSTLNTKVSEKTLKKEFDIYQLEISKNILYDWNSVIRQVTRPDDRMKYYDDKIKELRSK